MLTRPHKLAEPKDMFEWAWSLFNTTAKMVNKLRILDHLGKLDVEELVNEIEGDRERGKRERGGGGKGGGEREREREREIEREREREGGGGEERGERDRDRERERER